jgi:replicative DNA helicase
MIHPETLTRGEWSREDIARHYERDLLYVLVNEPDAEIGAVFPIVDTSDFITPFAGTLFEWLRRMYQRHGVIDSVLLLEAMAGKGNPTRALLLYTSAFVGMQFDHGAPQPWRVTNYAKEVHERAQQRRLVNIAEAEREALSGRTARLPDGTIIDGDLPAAEVLGKTDAARRILSKSSKGAAVSAHLSTFRERALKTQETGGLPFGLRAVDELLGGGVKGSKLYVVGARPGMGKTAWLLSAMMSWISTGHPGLGFSLEMAGHEWYSRLLTSRSGMAEGEWAQDWERVLSAADEIDKFEVNIADTAGITIDTVRAECERRYAEGTLDWVMLDYLTLMGGAERMDNQEIVKANSKGLKAIAKDFDVPVILAAQLNRKLEERQDKRPVMSDLRESGQIEQDADAILFLYRHAVYDQTYNPEEAEIIVAKQRGGMTGEKLVRWNGPLTRFEDYSQTGML